MAFLASFGRRFRFIDALSLWYRLFCGHRQFRPPPFLPGLACLAGYFWALGIGGIWPYAVICFLLTLFFVAYPQTKKKPWFLLPILVFSVTLVVRGILAFQGVSDFLLVAMFFESIFIAGLGLVFFVTLRLGMIKILLRG